jgi:hypothetical protein
MSLTYSTIQGEKNKYLFLSLLEKEDAVIMAYRYTLGRGLKVLSVCGVGQGSSLIMKMFVDDVFKELGVPASARSLHKYLSFTHSILILNK